MLTLKVVSFGYLHGPPPAAEITVDTRRVLHDPHIDPELREQTGRDEDVVKRVLSTPGAEFLAYNTATAAAELYALANKPVTVAVGCKGGRHRAPVIAGRIAAHLRTFGYAQVEVAHRDIHRPVVSRGAVSEYLPVPLPKPAAVDAGGEPAWLVHDDGVVTAYLDIDGDPMVRLPDGTARW